MQRVYSAVPPELKALPHWVNFRFAQRNGKITKPPVNPHSGAGAKSTDPTTWGTFEKALDSKERFQHPGIGFMFEGSGYFGVDLDDVYNPETGELDPMAGDIIRQLNSYTEFSPSGKGVHIICKGSLPRGTRRKGQLEMYDSGRYFTVTGKILGDIKPIAERSTEIATIHAQYFEKKKTPAKAQVSFTDDALLERARNASNGGKFSALFAGEHNYSSQSEADLALCNILAFWTEKDAARMDELFRQSGLMRSKWDEKHGQHTYGEMTVNKAISECTSVYTPHASTENVEGVWDKDARVIQALKGTPYFISNGALKERREDSVRELLDAVPCPVAVITRDDGAHEETVFTIGGWDRNGRPLPLVDVSAAKLESMKWMAETWHFRVNISAGQAIRDKVRHALFAIGKLTATQRTTYTHTGWRKLNGSWCFLHGAGAIGADDVCVELDGNLAQYGLEGIGNTKEAAQTSAALMEVAPAHIAVPLLATCYLAPLCEFLRAAGYPASFILFLQGITGSGKSTIASLALSHFGCFVSAKAAPASFADTANSIRRKAFLIKDMPLLVDDYHPTGNIAQRAAMENSAQMLARAYGDGAERGRLGSDLSVRKSEPPRGLCIVTGEDVPSVQESGLARFFGLEVGKHDIPKNAALTALQQKDALLRQAMTGYIKWLMTRIDSLPAELKAHFVDFRKQAQENLPGAHARQPEAVAHLMIGLESMSAYFLHCGIWSAEKRSAFLEESFGLLCNLAMKQSESMKAEHPSNLFIETLRSLVHAGRAQLVSCGIVDDGYDTMPREHYVGYIDEKFVYLDMTMALGAVNQHLRDLGRAFPVSKDVLLKHLAEGGYIMKGSDNRNTRTKRIGGKTLKLAWLHRHCFDEEEGGVL